MKRGWKIVSGAGLLLLAAALVPILYVETACSAPHSRLQPDGDYKPLLDTPERRPEARTWLTYPEWHIVYSADSLGRHLASAPPSGYRYWQDVKGFWSSYCLLNQVASGSTEAGDAKVMIYTIGLSFSAEMAVKALYENSLGRLFEWIGGWDSPADAYAARVQQIYGAFMHQTPWYRFPFGTAFSGLWRVDAQGHPARQWERRFALSAEYGVKAGYAKAIGAASGATLGRDQLTLRLVARATPARVVAVDRRLKPIRGLPGGRLVVEAPRYAAFTILLKKLAERRIELIEIAGNDDIFATFLMPDDLKAPTGTVLMTQPLGDRPGWHRVGMAIEVPKLLPLIAAVARSGGRLEHVYDY